MGGVAGCMHANGTKHYGVNTGGHDQVHRAAINQQ